MYSQVILCMYKQYMSIRYIPLSVHQQKQSNTQDILNIIQSRARRMRCMTETEKKTCSYYMDIINAPDIRQLPDDVVTLVIEYAVSSNGYDCILLSTVCRFFRYVLFSLGVEDILHHGKEYYTLPRIPVISSCHYLYDRAHVDTIEITSSETYKIKDLRLSCDTLIIRHDYMYESDDEYSESDSPTTNVFEVSNYVENISFSTLILHDVSYECFPIGSLKDKYPNHISTSDTYYNVDITYSLCDAI